jgi:Fe-S-cluster-containing hydrogenase component 2
MSAILLDQEKCYDCGMCDQVFPDFRRKIAAHGMIGANRNNPNVDWPKIARLVGVCRTGAITVRSLNPAGQQPAGAKRVQ